jgi:drug/metabolite transporter (DMT)-like permease
MSSSANSSAKSSHFSEWLSNQTNELICELQILSSLIFFAISFVGQRQAMLNGMSPLSYNAWRYLVSTALLYYLKEFSGFKFEIDDDEEENEEETSLTGVRNDSERGDNGKRTFEDTGYQSLSQSDSTKKDFVLAHSHHSHHQHYALTDLHPPGSHHPNDPRHHHHQNHHPHKATGSVSSPNSPIPTPFMVREDAETFFERYQLILCGLLMGFFNIGGSMLQQIGLVSVTAGKTGFITGMYVVFVPVIEYILIPKYRVHMTWTVISSVALSFVGLYVLSGCMEQEVCFGGAIQKGEIIVFISMLFWTANIIVADYGAKNVEVLSLTYYEFLITTIVTFIVAILVEPEEWTFPLTNLKKNWFLIILVGLTEAMAFALSTLGQMYTPPTKAAVLFSMESVTCAFLSYLVLSERLTYVELGGAVLMTFAALLSSLMSSHVEQEEEDEEGIEQEGVARKLITEGRTDNTNENSHLDEQQRQTLMLTNGNSVSSSSSSLYYQNNALSDRKESV